MDNPPLLYDARQEQRLVHIAHILSACPLQRAPDHGYLLTCLAYRFPEVSGFQPVWCQVGNWSTNLGNQVLEVVIVGRVEREYLHVESSALVGQDFVYYESLRES